MASTAAAAAALAIGLAATLVAWRGARADAERAVAARFEMRARDADARIVSRMAAYNEVLRAAAALHAASEVVHRDEFLRFVEALALEANYRGIHGVGYAELVAAADRERHVARVRAEGFAAYDIWPPGARDPYAAVVAIGPFAGRNLLAFGYDMYSDAVRRRAMERARDEGAPALTAKVTLIDEPEADLQPGFLVYLPVYRRGAPARTVEERRAAIAGWVYAPFRAGDLMAGVFGEGSGDLDLELYDGAAPARDALLYDAYGDQGAGAGGAARVIRRPLRVAGHEWTLQVRALPEFEERHGSARARLVGLAGAGASILLAALVGMLVGVRGALRTSRALNRELADAQRALSRSEALIRQIFDAAPDPIFLKDLDGRLLLANPATVKPLGRCVDDVVGRPPEQVYEDAAVATALTANDRLVVERGTAHSFEEVIGAGDTRRLFLVTKAPHRDADGRIVGVIGIAQDITDRKRRELELRRLAAAVEQAPVSVVIADRDWRAEYVNPAFERTAGHPREEILGRPLGAAVLGEDGDLRSQVEQAVAAGGAWSGQLTCRSRSGELLVEDAAVAPVKDEAGVVRNVVVVKRDVRRELELSRQLAESQRLETVARLAGGIAHDFNNLLTVILSCAEAMDEDLRARGTAAREDLAEVRAAAERARDLTRKLLAFARRQPIQPVPLALDAALREAAPLLRRLLREDIAVEVRSSPGLWTARCDPGQFEQVLLNLVVNAGDAMPAGGALTLATSNVVVDGEVAARHPGAAPGRYVRLAVADTGTGISRELQARVFEPFFTTKPVGKGTGLGLATVHGIVTQSGGFVSFDSEEGRGTTFEVLLPALDVPAAPLDRDDPPLRGGSETILVVEDEPHVRAVTRRALESGGYRVLAAPSGAEALETLARVGGAVDLLVTDVVMPGMNGRQLADRVRAAWPEVRVLFVSGHVDDVLTERGVLAAEIDLLEKPFTPAALLARVRRAIDRRGRPGA